jgi:hypothetical protein
LQHYGYEVDHVSTIAAFTGRWLGVSQFGPWVLESRGLSIVLPL